VPNCGCVNRVCVAVTRCAAAAAADTAAAKIAPPICLEPQ
jgi:hypothetical protein